MIHFAGCEPRPCDFRNDFWYKLTLGFRERSALPRVENPLGASACTVPMATRLAARVALGNAAADGLIAEVERLLAQGADIQMTDPTGWSALHFSSEGGHIALELCDCARVGRHSKSASHRHRAAGHSDLCGGGYTTSGRAYQSGRLAGTKGSEFRWDAIQKWLKTPCIGHFEIPRLSFWHRKKPVSRISKVVL